MRTDPAYTEEDRIRNQERTREVGAHSFCCECAACEARQGIPPRPVPAPDPRDEDDIEEARRRPNNRITTTPLAETIAQLEATQPEHGGAREHKHKLALLRAEFHRRSKADSDAAALAAGTPRVLPPVTRKRRSATPRDPLTISGAINATLIQPGDGITRHKPDAELMTYARAILARGYTSGTVYEAVHECNSQQWSDERRAATDAANQKESSQ